MTQTNPSSPVNPVDHPAHTSSSSNHTTLRLAGVIRESIVDGPGYRLVVFAQGCPHHCPGCQNPDTHSFSGGYESDVGRIMQAVQKNPLLSGVTFSGGEPFCQPEAFLELARAVHATGLNVMCYTGYTFEQLCAGRAEHPAWEPLLKEIDILVDGPFVLAEKSLALRFRGSKNQRIIDPVQSLLQNKIVEIDL